MHAPWKNQRGQAQRIYDANRGRRDVARLFVIGLTPRLAMSKAIWMPYRCGPDRALAPLSKVCSRPEKSSDAPDRIYLDPTGAQEKIVRSTPIDSLTTTASEQRVVAFGSAAARLMRAYVAQMEVLRRLRNGGHQFVRVEQVHINEWGAGHDWKCAYARRLPTRCRPAQ